MSGRTFFAFSGRFSPHDNQRSQGMPARLEEADNDFKSFCSKVMHETAHVQHWSRENRNWKSLKSMPESSFNPSDISHGDGDLDFERSEDIQAGEPAPHNAYHR